VRAWGHVPRRALKLRAVPHDRPVPAARARPRLSWIVLRATPSVRPVSRALTPAWCSRNIYRNCRMVSSLLAGIKPSSMIEGA